MADYFNRLHSDIKLNILSRVPTESVLDCKLVCKSWKNLVSLPSFSRIHLHRLNLDDSGKFGFLALTHSKQQFKYFEYSQKHPIERIRRVNLNPTFTDTRAREDTRCRIVGSCNGLICLAGYTSICICNPITREHVMLSKIKGLKYNWTAGFGYVSSTNEYKVVVVHGKTEVHIYTLGSGNGWRNLGKLDIDFSKNILEQGIFVNGALYWISGDFRVIFTFNLVEERFGERILQPPLPPNKFLGLNSVGVLDGFLCIAAPLTFGDGLSDIWLLEKKNDIKEPGDYHSWGWTKKFSHRDNGLVAVMKSGGVLIQIGVLLSVYDSKATTASKKLVDLKDWISKIFPHKNTFVSLKELGEADTEIKELVNIEHTESHQSLLEQLEEVEALNALISSKDSGETRNRNP